MITAILILTIFNTGLLIVLSGGIIYVIRKDMVDIANTVGKHIEAHTEGCINALGDAVFNMDSLKQKATMSGKVEV